MRTLPTTCNSQNSPIPIQPLARQRMGTRIHDSRYHPNWGKTSVLNSPSSVLFHTNVLKSSAAPTQRLLPKWTLEACATSQQPREKIAETSAPLPHFGRGICAPGSSRTRRLLQRLSPQITSTNNFQIMQSRTPCTLHFTHKSSQRSVAPAIP